MRPKRIEDGSGGFLTLQQEYDLYKGKTQSPNTSNSSLRPSSARADPTSNKHTDFLNKATNILGDWSGSASEAYQDISGFANNPWIKSLDYAGERSKAYKSFNDFVNNSGNKSAQFFSNVVDKIPGGKAGKALGFGLPNTLRKVPNLVQYGLLGRPPPKDLVDELWK